MFSGEKRLERTLSTHFLMKILEIVNQLKREKKGLGYSSVVQVFPSMCKTLGSVPKFQAKNQNYCFLSQGNIDLTRILG